MALVERMSYSDVLKNKKTLRILLPIFIICLFLVSFAKVDNVYADHRPAYNNSEQTAHDLCMASSARGKRGAIWFNTPSASYYDDKVNIASDANSVEVYIRGSFFSCGNGGSQTLNAWYINYADYKIPRLSSVGDTTVLNRGATTSSYNFSSQGGAVSATLDVSGLAMDGSKNSTVAGCDSLTSYCESISVDLYRCPVTNTPPSTQCYSSPLTINIVRTIPKPVVTPPTPPSGGSNGCRPISISVNPGNDANGFPVPVSFSIGGQNFGPYKTAQNVDVTSRFTTGDTYQVSYSTPPYISGYVDIYGDDETKPIYDGTGKTIIGYQQKYIRTDAVWTNWNYWSSSIGPCYDYTLTANITPLASRSMEVGSTTPVNSSAASASYTGSYHTKSKDTAWQITKLVTGPNSAISPLPNTSSSSDPCTYYKSATGISDCSALQTGNSVVPVNGGYFSSSFTVGDYTAGTKICFVFSVNPRSSDYGDWNHSAFDPAKDCIVVTKKPKIQITGGNLSAGGLVNTSTSVKNSRMFGSWTEYGVFAAGSISGMASGSAFASVAGLAGYSVCGYSTLSFTNVRTGTATCSGNNGTIGNYIGANTAADVASSFADGNTIAGGSIVANDLISGPGAYIGNKTGDLTLSASNLEAGKSIILKVSGTATITGNQFYENKIYSGASELPQLIIIADNINITDNVTNIDAWLIATNGNINTCSNFSGNLTVNKCTQLLTVNGPVSAKKLLLYRTAGSGTGANSGDPAEVFNLRADAYLWAAAYAKQNIKVQSVYTTELPPRF